MGRLSVEERVELHKAFWEGREMEEPLVSYRMGDFFYAERFRGAEKIRVKDTLVKPEMVIVEEFLGDYERMFQECEEAEQTAFWTAEPCIAIPWMEAMMGCPFKGEEVAFMALPTCDSPAGLGELVLREENPWYQKYMEFTEKLVELSRGRFPVGQSLLRGVSDVVGTKMGQGEFPYAVMDEPELMQEKFNQVAEALRMLTQEQYKRIPAFQGGYAGGLYSLWAPGKLVWYQEDLAAILSRNHYNQFLRETSQRICEGYDYTMVHLHPNSFHHLDDMITVDAIKCIQINKDVSGPGIADMLPQFKQVLEADKCLAVLGELGEEELALMMDELPHKRLFFHLAVPSPKRARELNRVLTTRWR
ncbi:MAG: hypothetical protein HFI33_00225 [Lachnospiraceae bacterium]|nr:hypothetical protein [Lachnospiraceae bacterium]